MFTSIFHEDLSNSNSNVPSLGNTRTNVESKDEQNSKNVLYFGNNKNFCMFPKNQPQEFTSSPIAKKWPDNDTYAYRVTQSAFGSDNETHISSLQTSRCEVLQDLFDMITDLSGCNNTELRKQIDSISNCCFSEVVKEKSFIMNANVKHTEYSEYISKYIENLNHQQSQLEIFLSSLKTQLTISTCHNMDLVTKALQKEIAVFMQFFPAFGLKQNLLNEIKKNQVTVITADCYYSLNLALPFILSDLYKNHSLIACEGNAILSYILQEKINSVVLGDKQTNQDMKLDVLSEEQLLKRFSFSTLFAQTDSCIIFNVPLKRSIIADILLSNLRDLLALQKNSKLILLLTPEDRISKYVKYFSSKLAVSVLQLPDMCMPTRTVWKKAVSSLNDDFVDDVVKTVFAIHAVCDPGDVMVFLPSFDDVQIVSEKLNMKMHYYQYNNIDIFCINDSSLDPFIKRKYWSKEKRHLFLLTSGYEGIHISSVRYVVDCGIEKEYTFNSQAGMNVICPKFISRQRTVSRTKLASMYTPGTCYKLYNKGNARKMTRHELAEIFCVDPLQSLLKFLQHCPQKRKSIQLVESLPNHLLEDTLKLLTVYGAIDHDLQVTSFGEELCKIPLSMKYSRLILFGLKSGFAYEAIVLVAFFSEKTGLFIESVDDDHQKLIDVVKFNFNQLDSDSLTFLSIFKQWKESGFKKTWCNEHYISFTTAKNIRHKVNELCFLIQGCLGIEINKQFSEVSDLQALIQMLFECFHNNLCVYTGHPRTGYQILNLQQFALIPSVSFLSQQKIFPDFIIYDDFSPMDSNYIINVTCVPCDFIMEYLQKGILNYSSSKLFDDKLVERVVAVGERIISQVLLKKGGKRAKEIEDTIKKEASAKVVLIEPDLGKGSVSIFAFPQDIECCFVHLNETLKKYVLEMTNEEETKIILLRKGPNIANIEIMWIKGAECVSASHALISLSSASAQNNSLHHSSDPLEFEQKSSINYSLKLHWPRRVCTGEGYVNLKKRDDFNKARKLSNRHLQVGEYEVFVTVADARGYQLLLSEIPKCLTEKAIFASLSKILQCEFEIELCYEEPFETSLQELPKMKDLIKVNVQNFTNIKSFEVKVVKPEPFSKFNTAFVNVFEDRSLDVEATNLSRTQLKGMPIFCNEIYFSDISCSVEVYNALKFCIKEELEIFSKDSVHIFGKNYSYKPMLSSDSVTIKLTSDDIKLMKSLQMLINQLLDGLKLDKTNLKNIHKLFCHGGHVFLKTLEKVNNVYIMANYETKTIRLYGVQNNCNYVRHCICNFIEDAENESFRNIILSSEKRNRIILKTIITKYGANLEEFIELCGLRSAALNIKTSCLSLYGKKESIEKAEECIKELSTATNLSDVCSDVSSDECPVCFSGQNLTIRLQHCGHLYCSECILGLVNGENFPIECCEENCSKAVLLQDIKSVLDDEVDEINKLAEKSLKAYLNKNRDKIFYCPAADCSMFVYKNEVKENKWPCPLCKSFICIKCNVVYHEGVSCDMYQGSKADPDYSFKVYQNTNKACKQCPTCQTAIEKKSGCNRMTCSTCKNHFCWICTKAFSSVNDAYNHIDRAHPGKLFVHVP